VGLGGYQVERGEGFSTRLGLNISKILIFKSIVTNAKPYATRF